MGKFDETLLMLLRATGTSNAALAKGCGVQRSSVGHWLKGHDPSISNVVAVCNFFQVTPNELTGFDELTPERLEEVRRHRLSVAPGSVRRELRPVDFPSDVAAEFDSVSNAEGGE